MPLQNVHKLSDGSLVLHRDIHNAYGGMLQKVTREAVLARYEYKRRPFILTRSFFNGQQKFGAFWTGDNYGTLSEVRGSVNMLLSSGMGGAFFGGADIPGYSFDVEQIADD